MLPELERGGGILPLSPQTIDEVWLVVNLQLFLHHLALPVHPSILWGASLPPRSSLCWLVTLSLLCNSRGSPSLSIAVLLRAMSSPPDLCSFIWVNVFHIEV